ncbi:MAG: LOG family protein [Tannerellaceae bacterium]|jgi:uncharacterized protein (TIGR00730 family)|nr:LOG family protein [Tannerellaceae bacterium]
MKTVTIFCSSYNEIDSLHFLDAEEIIKILIAHGCKIIFGGGANGLMGRIADIAVALNGNIEGIRHEELMKNPDEPFHSKVKIREGVKGIEQRKSIMYDEADILLILPGGAGTLEELYYSITCNRLNGYAKPILIFNKRGLYNSLLDLTQKLIKHGFQKKDYCVAISEAKEIVKYIE